MSYFTAVIGRAGSGWRALDVDVEDVDSLDELAQVLRSASRSGEPVLAVLEREDEWFAFVRVDDDEEYRAFVSDLQAAESSHYGELLAPVGDVELPEYAELRAPAATAEDPDDESADDADDSDGPQVADPLAPGATTQAAGGDGESDDPDDGDVLVHDSDGDLAEAAVDPDLPPAWAGDPGLLDDFGIDAADLVELVTDTQDDPASAVAGIGERCGFVDLLDALR